MRSVCLLVGLTLICGCGDKQEPTDELTGSVWQCVGFETDGKKNDDFDAELRFVRGGNEGRFSMFGPKLGTYEFKYTRDDSGDPDHMDLIDDEGTQILAVYSLTDDTFKLCYSMVHVDKRPKDFSTTNAGAEYSFVFERRK